MTLAQLAPYYGFTRLPFSRRIAASALYRSQAHQEALARIVFLIAQEALGLLTGEVGAGKTVAARADLAALDASRHTVIYLANPSVGARGLYHQIVTSLGGEPRFHTAALIPQAHELLAHERAERGKRVVVLIDEAHLLAPASSRRSACSPTPRWTQKAPSPASCSANLPSAAGSGSAASPRSTSDSRSATNSPA